MPISLRDHESFVDSRPGRRPAPAQPFRRLAPGETLFGHLLMAALRLPGSDPCGT